MDIQNSIFDSPNKNRATTGSIFTSMTYPVFVKNLSVVSSKIYVQIRSSKSVLDQLHPADSNRLRNKSG